MFKKVIRQANPNSRIDWSSDDTLIPETIKCIRNNEMYCVYKIDKNKNKTLIIETTSENRIYKAILKYLEIKLDHNGKVKNTPPP